MTMRTYRLVTGVMTKHDQAGQPVIPPAWSPWSSPFRVTKRMTDQADANRRIGTMTAKDAAGEALRP